MLFFWKNWNKQDPKTLYALFTGLFFLSIIAFLVVYAFGDSWVLVWENTPELINNPFNIDYVQQGIFEVPLQIDTYTVQERYSNSDIQIPTAPAWVWLGVFVVVWSWLLAQTTYLKRWLYLAFVTITIVVVVTLRIDLLLVYGIYSKWLIALTLLLNLLLSYTFFAFRKTSPLLVRFLAFLFTNLALGSVFIQGARIDAPALSLANYGMVVPFILSVFFILLVSNEIPHLFLYLIGRSNPLNSKNTLKHFIVITLIYLANLFLLFLKNSKILVLDIVYIDDFLILPVSAIIGLWGIQKNKSFEKYIPFKSAGAGIYIGLAILTFSCIGYASATMNTPLLAVYEDIIVYTHLAWGVAFFAYVFINFLKYKGDVPMYEVTFSKQEDKYMPLYIYRGLGYLLFTMIMMKVDTLPIKQSTSAYYNHVADVHLKNNDLILAEAYYQKASMYDYYNSRTLLSLAKIYNQSKREEFAVKMYEESTFRDRTPQAYVNMSNKLLKVDLILQAIYTLKDAEPYFPKNSQINNNLGLHYLNVGIPDSAFYYLNMVKDKELATANMLSFWAKNTASDSILASLGTSDNIKYLINKYAILNKHGIAQPNTFQENVLLEKDASTPVSWQTASYLYNYTLNQRHTQDSSSIAFIDAIMANEQSYTSFGEYLLLTKACYYYYNYEVAKAIDLLISIQGMSPELFKYVIGVWLMEAGDKEKAVDFLKEAILRGSTDVFYALAIAHTENGNWDEALEKWNLILEDKTTSLLMKQRAVEIKRIMEADANTILNLSDVEKYGFIYYNKAKDLAEAKNIANTIEAPTYQVAAVALLMEKALENGKLEEVNSFYQVVQGKKEVALWAQSRINLAYLKLLLAQKDYNTILANIDNVPLVGFAENYRAYFKGMSLLKQNKVAQAKPFLNKAFRSLPFEENAYLSLYELYKTEKKPQQSYDILVDGVRFLPKSEKLWQAYAYQCLEVKLLSYAETAQQQLKSLMSAEKYQAFEKDFLEKKQIVENEIYNFNANP